LSEEVGQEVTILDFNKLPSAKPGRLGKFDYIVTYRLPTGHVRIVSIPAEEIEGTPEDKREEVIKKYIKKDLAEWARWVGKKIKI